MQEIIFVLGEWGLLLFLLLWVAAYCSYSLEGKEAFLCIVSLLATTSAPFVCLSLCLTLWVRARSEECRLGWMRVCVYAFLIIMQIHTSGALQFTGRLQWQFHGSLAPFYLRGTSEANGGIEGDCYHSYALVITVKQPWSESGYRRSIFCCLFNRDKSVSVSNKMQVMQRSDFLDVMQSLLLWYSFGS